MRGHLSFRSGNPALQAKTFTNLENNSSHVMTLNGTVNKTAISLLLLMSSAYYTFSNEITSMIFVGFIGGFILALVTMFKKHLAPYTVPIYALLEVLELVGLSSMYNQLYQVIVPQAVFLTFGILFSLLFAYKTKIIQPSENFKLGIFAATGGIGVVYLISFVMSFFGSGLSIMNFNNGSLMSIGFSFFVVIIASLNWVLDFDFIEQGAEVGAPKYMEWYGAFGLLVTLIWLYIEVLRLLSKLQSRRS